MKHAILYARLSRVKGDDISVERQIDACSAYIKTHRLQHDPEQDIYKEPPGHRSGGDDSRPQFQALLKRIDKGDVSHIVCFESTRFSRADNLVPLLLDFQKRGISFVSLNDPVDISTTSGKMFARMKSAFGIAYREDISDRTRRAWAAIKKNGGWVGSSPQGLVAVGKGNARHLEKRPDTYKVGNKTHTYFDTVKKFYELYAYSEPSIGLPEISKRLNALGYRWRSKQGKCMPVRVNKLDDLHIDSYINFFPPELIHAVKQRLKERAKCNSNRREPKADFVPPLFYHVVVCSRCGKRLTSQRAGKKYYYYMHKPNDKCEAWREIKSSKFDAMALELAPIKRLLKLTDAEKKRIARRCVAMAQGDDHEKERAYLQQQLNRLEDEALSDLLESGTISPQKIQAKKEDLQRRLAAIPEPPQYVPTYDEWVKRLNDFSAMFARARDISPELANRLMRQTFEYIRFDIERKVIVGYELTNEVKSWLG